MEPAIKHGARHTQTLLLSTSSGQGSSQLHNEFTVSPRSYFLDLINQPFPAASRDPVLKAVDKNRKEK